MLRSTEIYVYSNGHMADESNFSTLTYKQFGDEEVIDYI